MGGGPYLLVLFIGAVVVIVDGQLIIRSSPAYLREVYVDPGQARQVSLLVGLFFHLVMLGVVALVASVGMVNPSVPSMLARIGVLLILTALGHAATIAVLARLRDQQAQTELAHDTEDEVAARATHGCQTGTVRDVSPGSAPHAGARGDEPAPAVTPTAPPAIDRPANGVARSWPDDEPPPAAPARRVRWPRSRRRR